MRRETITTAGVALIVPVVAVVAVLVTVLLRSESNDAASGSGNGNEVVIEGFAYSPTSLRVSAGTRIMVTNTDDAAHTLTADDGEFDTGDLDGGDHETITVAGPGRQRYHCEIHDYMTGVIEVDE